MNLYFLILMAASALLSGGVVSDREATTPAVTWLTAAEHFLTTRTTVLFFMHLPKTSGAFLKTNLMEQMILHNKTVCLFTLSDLSTMSYYDSAIINRHDLDKHNVSENVVLGSRFKGTFLPFEGRWNSLNTLSKCDFISGHANRFFEIRIKNLLKQINRQLLVVSFLRNPMDRYLSHYEHFIRSLNAYQMEQFELDVTLLQYYYNQYNKYVNNLQTSYFAPQHVHQDNVRIMLNKCRGYEYDVNYFWRKEDIMDCVNKLCSVLLMNCVYWSSLFHEAETLNITEIIKEIDYSQHPSYIAKQYINKKTVLVGVDKYRNEFLILLLSLLGIGSDSLFTQLPSINVNPDILSSYQTKYGASPVFKDIQQSEADDALLYKQAVLNYEQKWLYHSVA